MNLFGKKKKNKVIDLRDYKSPQKNLTNLTKDFPKTETSSEISAFGFGNFSSENSHDSSNNPNQEISEDKKSKLAKRFLEMTDKIEDLSNQIYHIKQRLEIIEKKLKINYD